MNPIKGFIGLTIGTSIGSAALTHLGNSGMSNGIKNATGTLVSGGLLGYASKMFKW
jgi:hypothetical protein